MVKLVNPLQPSKAPSSIEVTLEGRDKLVNPLQYRKAAPPIEITLEGMVKIVNPLQYLYLLLVDYQCYTL